MYVSVEINIAFPPFRGALRGEPDGLFAPRRGGCAEDRRAEARGETSPLPLPFQSIDDGASLRGPDGLALLGDACHARQLEAHALEPVGGLGRQEEDAARAGLPCPGDEELDELLPDAEAGAGLVHGDSRYLHLPVAVGDKGGARTDGPVQLVDDVVGKLVAEGLLGAGEEYALVHEGLHEGEDGGNVVALHVADEAVVTDVHHRAGAEVGEDFAGECPFHRPVQDVHAGDP